MKFLNVIIVLALLFFLTKYNLFLGLAAFVVVMAYLIYTNIPVIYRAKGRKCYMDGDYQGAKKYFKKAVDTGHAKGDIRIEYSYVLLRTGDIDDAEAVVNHMLAYKIKPEYRTRAIIQRCMCYYKQGNLEEAMADATDLYNDGFRSIMHYGMLGFFKIIADPMSQDTFDFCKEAYEYADDDRDICDNMLICYYNRGEYEKAKEISDKVVETSPKFVEAWYHAAQIACKLNDYEDALEKLEHIKECRRSFMTTISEEEIEKLRADIEAKLKK